MISGLCVSIFASQGSGCLHSGHIHSRHSTRAGLIFPVGRTRRLMQPYMKKNQRVAAGKSYLASMGRSRCLIDLAVAPVYLAAVIE